MLKLNIYFKKKLKKIMNYEDKHKFINVIKSDIKCPNTVIIDFLNIFTLFRAEKYKKVCFY